MPSSPPPPTIEELQAALTGLSATASAAEMCGPLFMALRMKVVLARDPALRRQVANLCNRAYNSVDFAHSYLSLGEDVRYMLEDLRDRPDYVAS